jgi:hypothetical protein
MNDSHLLVILLQFQTNFVIQHFSMTPHFHKTPLKLQPVFNLPRKNLQITLTNHSKPNFPPSKPAHNDPLTIQMTPLPRISHSAPSPEHSKNRQTSSRNDSPFHFVSKFIISLLSSVTFKYSGDVTRFYFW